MHFTSWVFPKGHRIRLAVNNAQWPMLWPTPWPMTTALQIGGTDGSVLSLPVVPAGPERRPDFAAAVASPELPGYASIDLGTSSGYGEISAVTRNPATGEAVAVATNTGASQYPWGREDYRERIEHRTWEAEPWKTSMEGTHEITVTLPDRLLKWEADLLFSSDTYNFHYRYTRRLFENGELLREKTWTETIPRDFQ
jgi:hypothetical protein